MNWYEGASDASGPSGDESSQPFSQAWPHAVRVVIADDHALLRVGLASILGMDPRIELIGEATNGREALTLYDSVKPDVVLMDLQMPDMSGVEATARIIERDPAARIIVLTALAGVGRIRRALDAGARGFLLKSHVRTELADTIVKVFRGQKVIDDSVIELLREHDPSQALTSNEYEILRHAAAGLSNKEIGRKLSMTEATVKNHFKQIMAKMGASDRTGAVAEALSRGDLDMF